MISLIIGHKGSGKTKHLIQMVNEAVESSKGNVVCVETVSYTHLASGRSPTRRQTSPMVLSTLF